MASLMQWTWTWANFGRWWDTERPGSPWGHEDLDTTGRLNNKNIRSLLEYLVHVTVSILLKWEKISWAFYLGSVQFSSVAQSCPTLCNPMNHSTPGLPVHHQLPQFTQTHIHRVSDAIQPSHPLWFPSPPAPNPSQHQSLLQWVNPSHEVAKVREFQL